MGLLLGDGHLRGNTNRSAYCLVVLQSQAHKEYVFHLYEIFQEYVSTPPRYYEFKDPRNPDKIYKRWYFKTTLQTCFRFYGQQFYKYGDKPDQGKKLKKLGPIKKVPKIIGRLLTPLALAYWYMDDGAAKWQGKSLALRYCTDNFTEQEVTVLKKCLEKKFNLQCTKQKKGGKDRIYVRHESYVKIKTLILHHIIPSMVHKFPREY